MRFFSVFVVLLMAINYPAIGKQSFFDDFEQIEIRELSNKVLYSEQVYSLRAGLEEVYRPDDNHSNSKLNVTDGEFYSTQVTTFGNLDLIWRARDAAVWFYVDMYSPGTNGFRGGEYSFMADDTDEDSSKLSNEFFFKKGKFAIDIDGDGTLDSDKGEFLKITGGKIVIEKSGDIYKCIFTFMLENGIKAMGSFTGDFEQV